MITGSQEGAPRADVERLHRALIAGGQQIDLIELDPREFGASTLAALRGFQSQHGLAATGVVDADTAAALTHADASAAGRLKAEAIVLNGAVNGKLVDEDGAPITGISITLLAQQLRAETPLGTTQTDAAGSIRSPMRGRARSTLSCARGKLYKQGLKVLGERDVPADTIEKMIKGGTRPAPGTQMDHAIDELARQPKSAIKAGNLGLRKGHAGVPGGSHYGATEGRKNLRESLRESQPLGGITDLREIPTMASEFGGANADPFEIEIDEMKEGGLNMLTGTATEGPAGAFKAFNPILLGKASVVVMGSPHMFGARGGFSSLATECMNPANCMKMDWRGYVINAINAQRELQGRKPITWGQLGSGDYQ